MRRADRLLQILMLMRGRRIVTAQALAESLEVSVRTVYRDMADLSACGVPLQSEAGVGYRLLRGFDHAPLFFDGEELAALRLAARMTEAWADAGLAGAARRALNKIETAAPTLAPVEEHLFAPAVNNYPRDLLAELRGAIAGAHPVELHYTRADGQVSQRKVEPLGLFFWGAVWTLGAWCRLREDFRSFRVDRIQAMMICTDELIVPDPARGMAALIASYQSC